jgi:hypothetical protein
MLTRVSGTLGDRDEYHKAKEHQLLHKLRQLAERTETEKTATSSSSDWRLDNLWEAQWWAEMDMEQEARAYPGLDHMAVQRVEGHA